MHRYWLADTYEARHRAGEEPQNIDKEFLRLWFRDNCDPYQDEVGYQHSVHAEPSSHGLVNHWHCNTNW